MNRALPSALSAAFPVAALLALAGCGILPKPEHMEILASQVQVVPDPTWPQVAWQLEVGRPSSNDMLDSNRLAVEPMPGRLQYYKGVSWNDSIPEIVQDAITLAFENSGRIVAVGRPTNGLRNDFSLQFDLREDRAVYRTPAGPPEVEIVLSARLIEPANGHVVASRIFRANQPASATEVHAVASAFNQALTSVAHDVVGWTLVSGEQARAAAEKH